MENILKVDFKDISEDDFAAYEDVRESGVTNMFAVSVVSELSGLPRQKIIAIMSNYEALIEKYPGIRNED